MISELTDFINKLVFLFITYPELVKSDGLLIGEETTINCHLNYMTPYYVLHKYVIYYSGLGRQFTKCSTPTCSKFVLFSIAFFLISFECTMSGKKLLFAYKY